MTTTLSKKNSQGTSIPFQWDNILKGSKKSEAKQNQSCGRSSQNFLSTSQKQDGESNDIISCQSLQMNHQSNDSYSLENQMGFSEDPRQTPNNPKKRKFKNKKYILQKAEKFSKSRFDSRGDAISQSHIGVQTNKLSQTISTQTLGEEQSNNSLSYKATAAKTLFDIKLHYNIIQIIEQFNLQNGKLQVVRSQAFQRLQIVIKKIFQLDDIKLEIFGSCKTNLALPTSDLDIVMQCPKLLLNNMSPHYILTEIHEYLQKLDWVDSQAILSANVPVVKLNIKMDIAFFEGDFTFKNLIQMLPKQLISQWDLTKNQKSKISDFLVVKIDLTIDTHCLTLNQNPFFQGHDGQISSNIISTFLYKYPSLMQLTLILKEFSRINSFDNAYLGGISSYCLTIMIVAFLRKDQKIYYNFGRALMELLEFYGSFNPVTTGISLNPQHPFFKNVVPNQIMYLEPRLVMFDPVYFNKYICPQSYQITKILKGFKELHEKLLKCQQKILKNLHDNHHLLKKDLNSYTINNADKIISGNILAKILRQFDKDHKMYLKIPKNTGNKNNRKGNKKEQHKKKYSTKMQKP